LANSAPGATTGMFIALNTSLVGGKVQWPEFARLAARVGYRGTDLDLSAAIKEGLGATETLLAELKLKISFANLPVNATRGDEDAFEKGLETLEDQVKFAAKIGCSRMMVVIPPASQTPKEELRKRLLGRFQTVGQVLSNVQRAVRIRVSGAITISAGLGVPVHLADE
jgi:sugar phosphate isomerase/epimerase